jgi:hypothetical protein
LLNDPDADLGFEPVDFDFGPPLEFPPYDIEPAMGAIEMVEEPPFDGRVKQIDFLGGDPALGTPVVALERQNPHGWETVLRPNGSVLDSTGPEIVLSLAVEPTYESDKGPIPRVFHWTARMPTRFSVPPAGGQLQGTFRLLIKGKTPDDYALQSQPFIIE